MKNLLRGKYSLLFLGLFIVVLYVLQNKAIVPMVMKVIDSNLFFVGEQEEEQLGNVKNQRTNFALLHCKDAMKEESSLPEDAEFLDDRYQAWALGNRTYIIRSDVRIVEAGKGQVEKTFACKIRLVDGDETEPKNWSVLGIEYHAPGEEG